MTLFIAQHLETWIPSESERVGYFYNLAKAAQPKTYSARYIYPSCAIICSSVNVMGYGLLLISRIMTSMIYQEIYDDSQETANRCFYDARRSVNSLYFAAGMATLIFARIFKRDVDGSKEAPCVKKT